MYWEETGRYPAVVVAKLKDLRDLAKEVRSNPGLAFGAPTALGVQLPMVDLKPSTQEAFRKRGVDETSKLRHADDRVLNAVGNTCTMAISAPIALLFGLLCDAH